MTSFEKFGEHFQVKILYHIITDKVFSLQVLDSLEPEFFTDESYGELFRIISTHYETYNAIPSFETLETTINVRNEEDEIQQKYLLDLLNNIKNITSVSDKQFIIDETVEFCQQQAMRNAILASVELLRQERYPEIQYIIQKAMQAGQSKDNGCSLFEDVNDRTVDKRHPVSTGFDILDDYVAGGPSAGELALVLAGTGVGKSMVLAHIAVDAMRKGKKVVYYTLELDGNMVQYRLEAKLTGIPLTTLLMDVAGKERKIVSQKLDELKKTFPEGSSPDVRVKFYPTKSASVNTLRNHLTNLISQDFVPDLVIVDYADLLKPTTRYNDKRFELESIVEQLRGMAGEFNVPVWSASQSNREGLDSSIVGLKSISESLAKAMVADLIVSVGRSPELVEAGRACYYLAKNRLGKDKVVFTGRFDTSILDFTIDQEGLDEDEVKQNDGNQMMNRAVREVLKQQKKDALEDGAMNRNLRDLLENIDGE